jgi:RNA polymerase sigma-70 factor (ECF subfamily)
MTPVSAVFSQNRPDELDDLALLRAAAAGDEHAAAAFFKRFHDPVLAFLSRLVGRDDLEIDDLVQATFLSALDAAERFEGRSQVRTWVLGIAANKARTHRRGSGRRRTAFAALPSDAQQQRPPSPSDGVKREQLRARLAAAVDTLSAREREAFLLCDVEGIGGSVAAETLGVPQGTMWRRLHDARSKLKRALAGER